MQMEVCHLSVYETKKQKEVIRLQTDLTICDDYIWSIQICQMFSPGETTLWRELFLQKCGAVGL
jgi:hypothetical protein